MKREKSSHFSFLLDIPSPWRTRGLNFQLSDSPKRSNASPRLIFPPKCSITSPRRTGKSYFIFSLPLFLTIIH